MRFTRRHFFRSTIAATAAAGLLRSTTHANDEVVSQTERTPAWIDTHVYFGKWPHARLSSEEPKRLVESLKQNNVANAWTGSFDGLFHKDIGAVNERLAEASKQYGADFLIPIGTVNPALPDWEEDVRRCRQVFQMPGIRLHPNYHGYTLDDPRFAKLLALASKMELFIQLVTFADEQSHTWLTPKSQHVDLTPLPALVAQVPQLRLLITNAPPTLDENVLAKLASNENIYLDFGGAKTAKEFNAILTAATVNRMVYASGAPLHPFDFYRSLLRELTDEKRQAIEAKNAVALVGRSATP